MKILAIDTSTKNLNIAVYLNGKVSGVYLENCLKTHSEILLANIDNLLKDLNLKLKDFDYYCCCVGPGSFTGIRIGVCTVKTFAQTFNKMVLAVNSNELYAYNENEKDGFVISVLNAMNNKLYYAVYKGGSEVVKPSICEIGEFKNIALKFPGRIISDIELPGFNVFLVGDLNNKLANLAYKKAARKKAVDFQNVEPLYVRLSAAEEKLGCAK